MASNKCSQEQTWAIGGKKELNYIYCQQLATLFIIKYLIQKRKLNNYANQLICSTDTALHTALRY